MGKNADFKMSLIDLIESDMDFNSLLKKRNYESYLKISEIIQDFSSKIKGKPVQIYLFPLGFHYNTSKIYRYNSSNGLKYFLLFYALAKNIYSGIKRDELVYFFEESFKKSGMNHEIKPIKIWAKSFYSDSKTLTISDERRSLIKLIKPITYKIKE